jgi:hypothetical protein
MTYDEDDIKSLKYITHRTRRWLYFSHVWRLIEVKRGAQKCRWALNTTPTEHIRIIKYRFKSKKKEDQNGKQKIYHTKVKGNYWGKCWQCIHPSQFRQRSL